MYNKGFVGFTYLFFGLLDLFLGNTLIKKIIIIFYNTQL